MNHTIEFATGRFGKAVVVVSESRERQPHQIPRADTFVWFRENDEVVHHPVKLELGKELAETLGMTGREFVRYAAIQGATAMILSHGISFEILPEILTDELDLEEPSNRGPIVRELVGCYLSSKALFPKLKSLGRVPRLQSFLEDAEYFESALGSP